MIDPQPGDEGRTVLYRSRPDFNPERGTVVRWTPDYVFVRYGLGSTAAATRREDLEWEHSTNHNLLLALASIS